MTTNSLDKEIAQNIGDGDRARLNGRLAWTFASYRDKSPNLYAILACHPGITKVQRDIVLRDRESRVKEHLMDVERESLNVEFEESWIKFCSEDFIAIRDRVSEQLGITIKQVA